MKFSPVKKAELIAALEDELRRREARRPSIPTTSIPLDYTHLHVRGSALGPSETLCVKCWLLQMPVDLDAVEPFPPRNRQDGEPPRDCDGVSRWVCLRCERGVIVTWSARA